MDDKGYKTNSELQTDPLYLGPPGASSHIK